MNRSKATLQAGLGAALFVLTLFASSSLGGQQTTPSAASPSQPISETTTAPATPTLTKSELKAQKKKEKQQEKADNANAKAAKAQAKAKKDQDKALQAQEKANGSPSKN